jgi:hypothetical protein
MSALERQYPRDLFDVKYFLQNSAYSDDHKEGLLLAVVSSNRPTEELFNPHLSNQEVAFSNQFIAMTNESFDYGDFETARENLLVVIDQNLTTKDKDFLQSLQGLNPDWTITTLSDFLLYSGSCKTFTCLKKVIRVNFKTSWMG